MIETLEAVQVYAFYSVIVCLALTELFIPARAQGKSVTRRWSTNIGLFVIALGFNRLLLPISALVIAEAAVRNDHGLLSLLDGPVWLFALLGVLLLDLWKYCEHRLFHGIGLLWRLHAVHHSDTEADFTTTERHHPIELVVGVILTSAVIYALGIPPIGVLFYLVLAPAIALFSHANLRVHPKIEVWLRWIIVTPRFHNVHHSAVRVETDSNFGVLLTVWDRLFRTYRRSTPEQDAARTIGLGYLRDARSARLDRVLCIPFLSASVFQEPGEAGARDEAETAS